MCACIAALWASVFTNFTWAQGSLGSAEPEISMHEKSVILGSDPDNFGFALAVALARTGITYQKLDVSDKEKEILRSLNTRTDKSNLKPIFGPYATKIKEAMDSPAPNPFYIAELVSAARSDERKFRTQNARAIMEQLSSESRVIVLSLVEEEMSTLKVHEHDLFQLAHEKPDVVLAIGRRFSTGFENYSNDRLRPEKPASTEIGNWGVLTR